MNENVNAISLAYSSVLLLFVWCLCVCYKQTKWLSQSIEFKNQSAWWNDTSWLINREMHSKWKSTLDKNIHGTQISILFETPPSACRNGISHFQHSHTFRAHFASFSVLVFLSENYAVEMIFYCIIFSLIHFYKYTFIIHVNDLV